MRKSLLATLALALLPAAAAAFEITVRVTNLQPPRGTFLTPVLFTTHDGTFRPFAVRQPASESVERIAEDGDFEMLQNEALTSNAAWESVATQGGPIGPWQTRTVTLDVDPDNPNTQFLSYISMVIPSNDAFLANVHPRAIPLFDDDGNLMERVCENGFFVFGDEVLDAGTEVNDEVPEHTAFLAQMKPNTGEDEGGVVRQHPGFQGSRRLGGKRGPVLLSFPQGDFTRPFAPMLLIEVSAKE